MIYLIVQKKYYTIDAYAKSLKMDFGRNNNEFKKKTADLRNYYSTCCNRHGCHFGGTGSSDVVFSCAQEK